LEKSARNGYTKAKHNLAVCYLAGTGTAQNNEQAFYWMEQASSEGHARATRKLGMFYIQGVGVAIDKEKGLSLLRKAISLGDEKAKGLLQSQEIRISGWHVKLLLMAGGGIIGSIIAAILGATALIDGKDGDILADLFVGAYFGFGFSSFIAAAKKEIVDFWTAHVYWGVDTTQSYAQKLGYSEALKGWLFATVSSMLWKTCKLYIVFCICPFIAVYRLAKDS
jgi:TPR repeat protein